MKDIAFQILGFVIIGGFALLVGFITALMGGFVASCMVPYHIPNFLSRMFGKHKDSEYEATDSEGSTS